MLHCKWKTMAVWVQNAFKCICRGPACSRGWQSCGHCCCRASQERGLARQILSSGKDQNSKFKIRFLLSAYCFHTTIKSKTIVSWGPSVLQKKCSILYTHPYSWAKPLMCTSIALGIGRKGEGRNGDDWRRNFKLIKTSLPKLIYKNFLRSHLKKYSAPQILFMTPSYFLREGGRQV